MDLTIGIMGDYDPDRLSHAATEKALAHAAAFLSLDLTVTWLPTKTLAEAQGAAALHSFDALWCAPGGPYQSMEGALAGIRYARTQGRPMVGT